MCSLLNGISCFLSTGKFGTGIQSYFSFLRFLITLNFAIFLLVFSFVILPSVIFRHGVVNGSYVQVPQQRAGSCLPLLTGFEWFLQKPFKALSKTFLSTNVAPSNSCAFWFVHLHTWSQITVMVVWPVTAAERNSNFITLIFHTQYLRSIFMISRLAILHNHSMPCLQKYHVELMSIVCGSCHSYCIYLLFCFNLLSTELHCTVYQVPGTKGLIYFYNYLIDLLSGTVSILYSSILKSKKYVTSKKIRSFTEEDCPSIAWMI